MLRNFRSFPNSLFYIQIFVFDVALSFLMQMNVEVCRNVEILELVLYVWLQIYI